MKFTELLRLVWLNLTQNKFKVIMTSVGIIVGAATIFMVIAIGKGGQMDIEEQFKNLNAGAIDITYEGNGSFGGGFSADFDGGFSFTVSPGGGGMSAGGPSGGMSGGGASSMNGGFEGGISFFPMFGGGDSMINQKAVTLNSDDVDEIGTFVSGISDVTISYSENVSVDGGELESSKNYTVAGTLDNYAQMSNITMALGEFITESDDENKSKICILGSNVAKEIFGSAIDAYDETVYIDDRPYVVNGVLEQIGTVSSGISPDDSIFIPYSTMEKYITGTDINPTITVIADDVNNIDGVIEDIETVLAQTYPNTEFTYTDAGSKMEAATASNDILTMLLYSMAAIVFIVGGIGIMNVLSLSVRERTKEIGILKSIGCEKTDILMEFLLEACLISLLGGLIGVGIGIAARPVAEYFNVRVELSVTGGLTALAFALLTGTVFGFYPAFQASRLVPVDALSEE